LKFIFIYLLVFRLSVEGRPESRRMSKAVSGLMAKGPSLVKGNGIESVKNPTWCLKFCYLCTLLAYNFTEDQ